MMQNMHRSRSLIALFIRLYSFFFALIIVVLRKTEPSK